MEVLIKPLIIALIMLVVGGVVVAMTIKKASRQKRAWLQSKIDNDEFVEGVITKRDVMTEINGNFLDTSTSYNYYIELDNHRRLQVKSLKEYNALPLNQYCKVLVDNDEVIIYIEGYTNLDKAIFQFNSSKVS